MIVTNHTGNVISVAVFGEFSLSDYKEFEDLVNYRVKFEGRVNLLFDLREMAGFTLDVAWEELKFARAHKHDFGRIAVVTDSQWLSWSAWLSQISVEAETEVFEDEAEARAWLEESERIEG